MDQVQIEESIVLLNLEREARKAADIRAEKAIEARKSADIRAEKAKEARKAVDIRAEEEARKAADIRIQEFAEQVKRLTCKNWITTSELSVMNFKYPDPQQREKDETALRAVISPHLKNLLPKEDLKTACEDSSRKDIGDYFPNDIFGGEKDGCQIAHIVPHATKCNEYWMPVVKLFSGIQDDATLKKILRGFYRDEGDRRADNSGILYQIWNHICVQDQCERIDNHPQIIFLPFKYVDWETTGFKCIVIADSPKVYFKIGANNPTCKIMTERLDSEDIQNAFRQFQTYSLTIVNYMRHVENIGEDTSAKLCKSLHRFLKDQEQLPLPYIQVDQLDSDLCFRVIEFGPAVIKTPGTRSVNVLQAHPAPCPFFLILQSLNAWFTALYQRKCRGAHDFLKLGDVTTPRKSCVLFPACRDDCETPNCTFCLAQNLLNNPHSQFTMEDCENLQDAVVGLKGEEVFSSDTLKEIVGNIFFTPCLQIQETDVPRDTKESVSEQSEVSEQSLGVL